MSICACLWGPQDPRCCVNAGRPNELMTTYGEYRLQFHNHDLQRRLDEAEKAGAAALQALADTADALAREKALRKAEMGTQTEIEQLARLLLEELKEIGNPKVRRRAELCAKYVLDAGMLLDALGARSVVNGEIVAWSPSDLRSDAPSEDVSAGDGNVEGCGCSCPVQPDYGCCCPCSMGMGQPEVPNQNGE